MKKFYSVLLSIILIFGAIWGGCYLIHILSPAPNPNYLFYDPNAWLYFPICASISFVIAYGLILLVTTLIKED